ncbi:preprotein translocase subunit YajC [Streptomyces sp. SL13]|uniref:Preprotein translocase subunit YajC n=1 Tax=Streptantibioticus silvisoli TaxID=2705255 RepID=A0AA90H735_9ACTN|nr:preprotein translocase subunit YajC [Streptantibioticus silvisoli]MDI5964670.1 preprotein translocase subunit YajC [Streptantibioticus silvisoli]MDI5972143.1 preprotein translocase subunit YajC [Streptantibioticus silvisoli]
MNTTMLLPIVLIIGLMLLMTRSAKNKQRQATQMRDQMQPGSGVRTIGGLVARVKEIRDSTVLLEVAPGTHCVYTKQAVATVLSEEEYDRLVNNDVPLTFDDSEEATVDGAASDEEPKKIDLGKSEPADDTDEPAVMAAESGVPAQVQEAGKK